MNWLQVVVNALVVIIGVLVNAYIVERFKTKISLQMQHTLSIKKMEMEAIFSFNKAYTKFFLEMNMFNFFSFDFTTFSEIPKYQDRIINERNNLLAEDAHLMLFISGNDFIETLTEHKTHLSELEDFIYKELTKLHAKYLTAINLATGMRSEPERAIKIREAQKEIKGICDDLQARHKELRDKSQATHFQQLEYLHKRLRALE